MRIFWLAMIVALSTTAAGAVTFNETKITPRESSVKGRFGTSTALFGTTAIIGGTDGAAYLFDAASGEQTGKLTVTDIGWDERFGRAVDISGGAAIVGATGVDTDRGEDSGAAYVFDTASGNEVRRLTAADAEAEDYFGGAVGISGNRAIVGALGDNGGGAAYVFDAATGRQTHKLKAAGSVEGDNFGSSLAIDGKIAVVGDLNSEYQGSRTGSAYTFDTDTGKQLAELNVDRTAFGRDFGQFGAASDISGSKVLIGDPLFADERARTTGAAFLFDAMTGELLHEFAPPDGESFDNFGWSVSLFGDLALVGAIGDDAGGAGYAGYTGAAFLFDAVTGDLITKTTASDGEARDWFGSSVALSDSTLLIGSSRDDAPETDSGSAYILQSADIGPTPVPLPAGAWLLASALGAGALTLGRRRT